MNKRVLLVDDSETAIQFERMLLRHMGLEIAAAKSGKLALQEIAARRPDLVLLDMVMPDMDGMETLRHLKGNPETKTIPVIVVTTKGDPELVTQALEAGCDEYVTRPVDKAELLAKLKRVLSQAGVTP